MARRKLTRKTSGGGAGDMPIRRSYEREALEMRGKYGDPREIRPRDRATEEEVRQMKLSPKVEQRIAEMDREIAVNEMKHDPERLRLAQSLNDHAEEMMETRGIGFPEALREVVKLAESGASEPSVAEVERYMKDNDVQDFGAAVRTLAAEHGNQELGGVRPGTRMTTAQEDAELERAIKERGYDV